MAQQLTESFTCDWDGESIPDGEVVTRLVTVGRDQFEVHLCGEHSAVLDGVTARADRVAGPKRSAAMRRRTAAIRAWAVREGLLANGRGRIPVEVVQKYEARGRS